MTCWEINADDLDTIISFSVDCRLHISQISDLRGCQPLRSPKQRRARVLIHLGELHLDLHVHMGVDEWDGMGEGGIGGGDGIWRYVRDRRAVSIIAPNTSEERKRKRRIQAFVIE
jgi:hypothetical protein